MKDIKGKCLVYEVSGMKIFICEIVVRKSPQTRLEETKSTKEQLKYPISQATLHLSCTKSE